MRNLRDCQHIIDKGGPNEHNCLWAPNDHIHQLDGNCDNGKYERHHAFDPNHEHRYMTVCFDCGHETGPRPA